MRLLLDTCTFLWVTTDSPELSPKVRQLFADSSNEVFLSAVSVWEMLVKEASGKLPLPAPAADFISQNRISHGIATLPLDESSALQLAMLPRLHRDPFDRMLVCQALANDLTLLTPDSEIRAYPVTTVW